MEIDNNLQAKLKLIEVLILDVDGVMTDGSLIYLSKEQGWSCQFNVKDGYGVKNLINKGFDVAIISSAPLREAVKQRASDLGIAHVYMGVADKLLAYQDLKEELNITNDNSYAYMGDDIPDLELLRKVGLSASPSDAVKEIISMVEFVSSYKGGKGAVREFSDLIATYRQLDS